jgi:hypothetical protein
VQFSKYRGDIWHVSDWGVPGGGKVGIWDAKSLTL